MAHWEGFGARFGRIAIAGLCTIAVAGCTASTAPFNYMAPYAPDDGVPPPWDNATVTVVDNRADQSVDAALATGVIPAIGGALASELRNAGFASEASFGKHLPSVPAEDLQSQGVDVHLVADVQELRWEVVNYGTLQATAFLVGFTTGLVGAMIMGSIETDVDGHAKIDVRLTDIALGRSFSKTYSGHCEREWPIFECDTPSTKRTMVVCAFELAIRDLRADLNGFASTLPPPSAPDVEVPAEPAAELPAEPSAGLPTTPAVQPEADRG